MRTVHIEMPNGSRSQYNEDYFHVLLQRGAISQDCVYWIEGMQDWQPIANYSSQSASPANFAPPVPPQPAYGSPTAQPTPYAYAATLAPVPQYGIENSYSAASPYSAVQQPISAGRHMTVDLKNLTLALKVFIWLIAATCGIMTLVQIGTAVTLSAPGATTKSILPLSLVGGLIGICQMGLNLTTIVLWCVWVHRAASNVRGFGAQGLQYTPGWAVGWYFIPFANLIMPFKAMNEIWSSSKSPGNWESKSAPAGLQVWWALWIVSNILNNISFRLAMSANMTPDLQMSAVVNCVAEIAEIAVAIAAINVIQRIYQFQVDYVSYRS